MTELENIRPGGRFSGIAPGTSVEIVSVEWIGEQAVNVVYRAASGSIAETTLYRDDQHRLELESAGRNWSFDADGSLLRLVTEANRIKLAQSCNSYQPCGPSPTPDFGCLR